MRIQVKHGAISAESESIDEAELLLSLRSRRTSLAPRKRGFIARRECPTNGCTFIAKNEMGMSVHLARAHKQLS